MKYILNSNDFLLEQLNNNFYKWFGKSKIVNPDGSPKIVYHGSDNIFDEFDYNKIGKLGTSRGFGFYFINDATQARAYADNNKDNIYQCYLKIEKPLNDTKISITKLQLEKFIKALDPVGNIYLCNYGDVEYDGYGKILRMAIENEYNFNNDDVELTHSIINACGGLSSIKKAYNALYKSLGFDGIIIKDYHGFEAYVSFFPQNIKSINAKEFNINSNNIYD